MALFLSDIHISFFKLLTITWKRIELSDRQSVSVSVNGSILVQSTSVDLQAKLNYKLLWKQSSRLWILANMS